MLKNVITFERLDSALFLKLPLAGQFWIERQGKGPTSESWFSYRNDRDEHLVWLGRLHLIWTPAGWSPPPREAEAITA